MQLTLRLHVDGKVELDTCKLSKVVLLMRFLGNGLQAKLAVAVERRFPLERTAYTVESRYIFSTKSGNWDLETVGSHEQREVVCKVHMQRYLLCSKYLSRIALFQRSTVVVSPVTRILVLGV